MTADEETGDRLAAVDHFGTIDQQLAGLQRDLDRRRRLGGRRRRAAPAPDVATDRRRSA